MYVQYLVNTLVSPSSIKNYCSGAKLWVLEHLGDVSSFICYESSMMLKAVVKKSNHVPRCALPLTLTQVYRICDFLDLAPSAPLAIKASILIGYACYLRASNLTCPSINSWNGPHTLCVADIVVTSNGVLVTVNSTKSSSVPMTVLVFANPNSRYCPKAVWLSYIRVVNPSHFCPAFVINNGQPLTPSLLVDFMKAALASDPNVDTSRITTHSLRRGATQNAANANLPISEIMKRGGWHSKSGITPYLSK